MSNKRLMINEVNLHHLAAYQLAQAEEFENSKEDKSVIPPKQPGVISNRNSPRRRRPLCSTESRFYRNNRRKSVQFSCSCIYLSTWEFEKEEDKLVKSPKQPGVFQIEIHGNKKVLCLLRINKLSSLIFV